MPTPTRLQDRGEAGSINHGVFAYPVLMAADILLYDSDVVPGGKDQVQHVEMCRDMAQRTNHLFGDCLKLPKAQVKEEVQTIIGTDGQKMSKSYDNTIPVFLPKKKLRKAIMGITTDSKGMEEPKNPDSCNIFARTAATWSSAVTILTCAPPPRPATRRIVALKRVSPPGSSGRRCLG